MNYRVIYIILFVCLPTIWAQKLKALPNNEIIIYKIIKNPATQQDSLVYIGKSKAEIIQGLGQPEIDRNDDNNGDDLGYVEMALGYIDNNPETYDVLMIDPNKDGSPNPYVISKKYKLGIGRSIPKELLNSVEYRLNTQVSTKPLTPTEEAALPQATWKQYSFQIALSDGTPSDGHLAITVQDGKIIKIYIGY